VQTPEAAPAVLDVSATMSRQRESAST